MTNELSKQIDIAKHVIDGSLTIDSTKEFEGILHIFPKDPALYRAFSDMLMRKKRFAEAAQAYHKSTDLFISSGKILPALLCKRLQWRLKKPSRSPPSFLRRWNLSVSVCSRTDAFPVRIE